MTAAVFQGSSAAPHHPVYPARYHQRSPAATNLPGKQPWRPEWPHPPKGWGDSKRDYPVQPQPTGGYAYQPYQATGGYTAQPTGYLGSGSNAYGSQSSQVPAQSSQVLAGNNPYGYQASQTPASTEPQATTAPDSASSEAGDASRTAMIESSFTSITNVHSGDVGNLVGEEDLPHMPELAIPTIPTINTLSWPTTLPLPTGVNLPIPPTRPFPSGGWGHASSASSQPPVPQPTGSSPGAQTTGYPSSGDNLPAADEKRDGLPSDNGHRPGDQDSAPASGDDHSRWSHPLPPTAWLPRHPPEPPSSHPRRSPSDGRPRFLPPRSSWPHPAGPVMRRSRELHRKDTKTSLYQF
ncbi:Uu.00g142390.m01.CDS01 [Anthostomella pinea]|uniref:Uu.00g142390.m01.CDS01 n=1 Tax=Anthostomella pinea TaxID=933095 RepID=A0AAI8YLF7_9PEZI|nr:Uu.00g142390.m01.CDS01 [Anthostomella pinea]